MTEAMVDFSYGESSAVGGGLMTTEGQVITTANGGHQASGVMAAGGAAANMAVMSHRSGASSTLRSAADRQVSRSLTIV